MSGDEKLLSIVGGSRAVCEEIDRVVAADAPGVNYSIQVRGLSKSRLVASLVVNGRALPDQHFAIMDSELNAGAIRRFADALGRAVAEGAKSAE